MMADWFKSRPNMGIAMGAKSAPMSYQAFGQNLSQSPGQNSILDILRPAQMSNMSPSIFQFSPDRGQAQPQQNQSAIQSMIINHLRGSR